MFMARLLDYQRYGEPRDALVYGAGLSGLIIV
jgi:hypothetical protein